MKGTYAIELVLLSLAVAIVASYTALELAARASQHRQRPRLWLIGGATSLGIGIWSMHFIGMLAYHLPIAVAYDLKPTILSLLIAVAVSALALFVASRDRLDVRRTAAAACLMGLGISAMHYTGMEAIRMSPPIEFDPATVAASIAIAIAASVAALWIAFRLRHAHFGMAFLAKLGSACVMGAAITGMHYTGMAAARFAPGAICLSDARGSLDADALGLLLGIATMAILLGTLLVSALDAHRAEHAASRARSLEAAHEALQDLALRDALTGLPNTRLLGDRMERAIAAARREGHALAVMFIDLDRFKPVNDTLGHHVGDLVLQGVATRLSALLRGSDTVARVGGDEFVVLLGRVAHRRDAALVAQNILEDIARPFPIDEREVSIAATIGISLYPQDGADAETLRARADAAMYRAKRSGRNAYGFYLAEVPSSHGERAAEGCEPRVTACAARR